MELDCAQKECYNSSDNSNKDSAEVRTCEATTVTALACNCVCQQEDPTDYGNSVQNCAPKIVPRRERSVCLGKKLVGSFGVDFDSLILFHVFFTLSSAVAEILHL